MPSCGTEGKIQREQNKSVAADFNKLLKKTNASVTNLDEYRMRRNILKYFPERITYYEKSKNNCPITKYLHDIFKYSTCKSE